MTITSKERSDRLIKEFKRFEDESMTDFLSIAARDIEDALLQCGAEPGKDYTYMDLFKLAVQLATVNPEPSED